MKGKMDCRGLTNVGKVRENNEDQFLIADLSRSMRVHETSLALDDQTRLFGSSQGILLLVADGMGGHAAGERASRLAIDSITTYLLNAMHWMLRLDHGGEDDFIESLKLGLEKCQADILADVEKNPEHRGMGTTLTMAYVVWPKAYIVHAGDSRCYLLRGSQLEQITTDHTVAQRMVEAGQLAAADAERSRFSNLLWNVVGGGGDRLNPEVHKVSLQMGDHLLLCTDGLHKHVPDEDIRRLISGPHTAEQMCASLVNEALEAGGTDNVTVVVARFEDVDSQDSSAAQAAAAHEPSAISDQDRSTTATTASA